MRKKRIFIFRIRGRRVSLYLIFEKIIFIIEELSRWKCTIFFFFHTTHRFVLRSNLSNSFSRVRSSVSRPRSPRWSASPRGGGGVKNARASDVYSATENTRINCAHCETYNIVTMLFRYEWIEVFQLEICSLDFKCFERG